MTGWRGRLVVPLVAAMSLVALGCAKPPTDEKKAADGAAQAAKTAGAETYARSEFVAMTAALRKAEAEMTARAYKEARASYLVARGLADKAAAAADARRATASAEAGAQLAAVERRWKDLYARGQSGAATLKAEQRAVWNANARTVIASLESARAAIAGDAGSARQKLAQVTASIDKAEADLAVTAAPAAKAKTPAKGR